MKFKPYAYQQSAINVIEENACYGLFLDMGLGKTVITLTAIDDLIYNRFAVSRVLIIAPKRVAESTWQEEAQKWDHLKGLRFSTILGTPDQRKSAVNADADVYIINRENVVWLFKYLHDPRRFDMLVIDESSSFKSPKAERFKALKKMLPCFRRRVILTGTPTSNTMLDLWAQIYILDLGKRLGKYITAYRTAYFEPEKRSRVMVYTWRPQKGAEDRISEKIRDICLSMKAADYITLPKRIDNIVSVPLPPSARKAYNDMIKDQVLELNGQEITALQAAAVSNKLLQIANGSVYTDAGGVQEVHDAKARALLEIVEGSGSPVLVFYSFRHDVQNIRGVIPAAVELNGPETLAAWNAGKIRVLLAHPASAGYGLNMQAGGHVVVWYGLTWSLEQYQQANARLYRQGQDKPVIIHHIVAKSTIDEKVLQALRMKKKGQDALLDAVKEIIKGGG